jgi:CheY-like chemotaxis protein
VVSNLVTNAIKFTAAGGRVLVRLASADGQAELSVSDTGVGISPEFLPYVFDRFRQADSGPTRPHGGLGLGLAIVRHLVRLHGGTVQAMSGGPGKGATFIIELPLADASGAVVRPPAPERPPRPARLDGVTVLLVEDDDDTRSVVRAMLEEAGAAVATASSAEEGRRALLSMRPAVLVSDIAMPSEDGYVFLRSLRAADITVPAIALTAYARREDAAEAFAAGFQLHLPKPVNRIVLISAIASLAAPPQSGADEMVERTA